VASEAPAWSDFETGAPLDLSEWPDVRGVPVLVPDARAFLVRHGLGPSPFSRTVQPDPLPIDAPDPLTPHLPPGRWPKDLLPVGDFGAWVELLGERCPDAVCADWGHAHAPDGPALDAGCGVGGMARRMAEAGRSVCAFDRSPAAVLLARDLVSGNLPTVYVPLARSAAREVAWPHGAQAGVQWAIADVLVPPLPPESFAWIHLGSVVDMVDGGPEAVIDAVSPLLMSGGLLTIATPHDEDRPPIPGTPDPTEDLRHILDALGLHVIAQDRAVPWVVRQYDRGYRVLLTDCLAARASW